MRKESQTDRLRCVLGVCRLGIHTVQGTLQDWRLINPFVSDCDLETMNRLLRKNILRLPKHVTTEARPRATGRQHRGCIIPQAVTHSLVLLKMGKIIARNMLS